jgi:glycosyltransferase involved in cell wall biosynthesis
VPYPPGLAPSQRFRFEQYLPLLESHGHSYQLAPFLDAGTWDILYKRGHAADKVRGVLAGLGRRLALLFRLRQYDFVFVHREATPLGPPVLEWLLAKVWRKRLIYDFDDAIWLHDDLASGRTLTGRLKWTRKVESICRWAWRVSCGNAYLASYARQFNPKPGAVVVNPTTLDTQRLHNRLRDQSGRPGEPVIIGWTGTHSTLPYLEKLWPVFRQLEADPSLPPFELHIIANRAPTPDPELRTLRFVPWRKETEIDDLLSFHFGLMPLEDDAWAQGKCAFKALQYMALGMPALVSPVGMNTEVVESGINGFVCDTPAAWEAAIRRLLTDADLRARQGAAARQTIVARYSVASNEANFLRLFQ